MYRFHTCPIEGEATRVLYRHPTFIDYGLALTINREAEQHAVECHIVTGVIDGESKLDAVTDHTIPLDVQIWCFTAMRTLRDSVNTDSLDLNALFTNNSGIYYYTVNQEN